MFYTPPKEPVDEDRLIWKSSQADFFAELRESIIKNAPPIPPRSVTPPIEFLPPPPRARTVDSTYPESSTSSSSGEGSTLSLAARCRARRRAALLNQQAAAGASALSGVDLSALVKKIVESGQQAVEAAKAADAAAVAGPSVAPSKGVQQQQQRKQPEERPRRVPLFSKPTSAGKQRERASEPAEERSMPLGDCLNHKSKSLDTLPFPFRKSSQGTSDSPICIDDDSNDDDGSAMDVDSGSPRKRTPIVSPTPSRRASRTFTSSAAQQEQLPPPSLPLHQHSQQRRLGMRGPAVSAYAATSKPQPPSHNSSQSSSQQRPKSLGMKGRYTIQVQHQAAASSVKSRVPPKQTALTKPFRTPRPAAPAPVPPPRTPPRTHAMSVVSPADKSFSSDTDVDMDALEEVMRKYDN
ncbi:hypothetical protein BOTBODRAFT_178013 [Botryobasidium botryosum FD-172 SS1]|uniref:Uncharacterized protein n=1 Tax=Botryobasidium botryosum (strain FD-172 SS1) TaxID=930990 RepID=A0A067MFS8_BOTB1|nr:hypothetical protein BOTBODRAFT_178013 [Botryobasidium botryosum FD-172 SS1]